jgi:DNA-binding MarR family transcriptional regulator
MTMSGTSTPPYAFGDLLALARQSWIAQMASGVGAEGYRDYRRSDAGVLRLLQRGPVSVGQLGEAMGVTRQAARKVAQGLEDRGYAVTVRDERDSRQLNIVLTPDGEAYARVIVTVIGRLNREIAGRVAPAQLAAADAVLRAAMTDDHTRTRAAYLPRPPLPPG